MPRDEKCREKGNNFDGRKTKEMECKKEKRKEVEYLIKIIIRIFLRVCENEFLFWNSCWFNNKSYLLS